MFQWTVSPENAPDKAEQVEIGFERGVPVSLNGRQLSGAALMDALNGIEIGRASCRERV